MKNLVKNKLTIAILSGFAVLSSINNVLANVHSTIATGQSNNTQQVLFSSQGYPYKNLLSKTDLIKIIYTQEQDNVECSVELELDDLHLKSQSRTTSKDKFTQAPLASCLKRKQAKMWLKAIYQ